MRKVIEISNNEINNKEKNFTEINNVENNSKLNTENKVVLELPFLYYHGYTTKINGKKVKNYESKNGFLCIETTENGKVEVNYTGTVIEKLSKKVKNYESKNGFLCIETTEDGKVEVNYTGTVIEKLSIAVSILTLSGILIYLYNKNAKLQNIEK